VLSELHAPATSRGRSSTTRAREKDLGDIASTVAA